MKFRILLSYLLLSAATASQAEITAHRVNIETLLTDANNYGGCMAQLTNFNNPAGCGRSWVTFDCSGLHNEKEAGRRALELAQMAFALEKEVIVFVETTEKINGYCTVKRLDLKN